VTVNRIGGEFVEATPAKLVAAVKQLDGVEVAHATNTGKLANEAGVMNHWKPGPYLVVPVSASGEPT
jgi:hypothetical protein